LLTVREGSGGGKKGEKKGKEKVSQADAFPLFLPSPPRKDKRKKKGGGGEEGGVRSFLFSYSVATPDHAKRGVQVRNGKKRKRRDVGFLQISSTSLILRPIGFLPREEKKGETLKGGGEGKGKKGGEKKEKISLPSYLQFRKKRTGKKGEGVWERGKEKGISLHLLTFSISSSIGHFCSPPTGGEEVQGGVKKKEEGEGIPRLRSSLFPNDKSQNKKEGDLACILLIPSSLLFAFLEKKVKRSQRGCRGGERKKKKGREGGEVHDWRFPGPLRQPYAGAGREKKVIREKKKKDRGWPTLSLFCVSQKKRKTVRENRGNEKKKRKKTTRGGGNAEICLLSFCLPGVSSGPGKKKKKTCKKEKKKEKKKKGPFLFLPLLIATEKKKKTEGEGRKKKEGARQIDCHSSKLKRGGKKKKGDPHAVHSFSSPFLIMYSGKGHSGKRRKRGGNQKKWGKKGKKGKEGAINR